MFDLPVYKIDLLPDFAGYILMYFGLKQLEDFHLQFRSAKQFAIFLFIISLIDPFLNSLEKLSFAAAIMYQLLYMVLNMLLIYKLCKAIIDLARAKKLVWLARSASFRCSLYLASMLFTPIIIVLGFVHPALAGMMFLPSFLFSLIVLALLMGLMRQADQSLGLHPYA